MPTLFSKIINQEIPAQIIYEDHLCVAFHDIQPQAPVHVLLVPRKEISGLSQAEEKHDKELLGHLLLTAAQIAKDLGINETGYRLVINTNKDAGQTVFHLHIHILGGAPLKSGFGTGQKEN